MYSYLYQLVKNNDRTYFCYDLQYRQLAVSISTDTISITHRYFYTIQFKTDLLL